jgi:shikimate dehydrogenase
VTRAVRGSTRVAGIIGDPIAHSRSPAIHNAAFAALGLDWVFVAFPVRDGDGERAVRSMVPLHLAGLNVTMPHKTDAARACDELSVRAATLQSVNAIVLDGDTLRGDSTDGEGLVRSLVEEGRDPAGRECLVLGAGGAGRAIAHALGDHGAKVTVAARRPPAAAAAAALASGGVAAGFDDLDRVVARTEVLVNATPLGMRGEAPPFDPDRLHPGQFVLDTIYHPAETTLLAAARARDVPCANGLGMLVHQAALAFELWTGETAPLAVMREAARAENP